MSSDRGAALARELPDTPRYIETRAILRSGHAQLFGGSKIETGFVVRLLHGAYSVVAVVGRPPATALSAALDGTTPMTPIIAQAENADYVDEALRGGPETWRPERMLFHRRPRTATTIGQRPDAVIRMLTDVDPLDHLPVGLRYEIDQARRITPVATAVVDDRAVTFCYSCFRTETLWDLSIDTVEGYRRRGLGLAVCGFMIEEMRRLDLEPVWGALVSNTPSLQLATRLGFTPLEKNIVFARGGWAYLTNGFTG